MHHPFEATHCPFLIFTNGFNGCRSIGNLLRDVEAILGAYMSPFEPGIRVFLHRVENLVLTVPKAGRSLARRVTETGRRLKYGLRDGEWEDCIGLFHDIPPVAKVAYRAFRQRASIRS